MSLQARLNAFKTDLEAGAPPNNVPRRVIDIMRRAPAERRASGLAGQALRVGQVAPASTLADPDGVAVSSASLPSLRRAAPTHA